MPQKVQENDEYSDLIMNVQSGPRNCDVRQYAYH